MLTGTSQPPLSKTLLHKSLHLVCQTHPVVLTQSPLTVGMKVLLQMVPKRNLSSVVATSLVFFHVPVPWGKLTKGIVLEVFKDVHTGLGTLGPPLHISMNPNVTPVQAHPHRCPVAKQSKVAEAIRDMEK